MNFLKNLPFHSEETESFLKKNKKFSNIRLLSELPFFSKISKKLTKNLSKELPLFPKRSKRPKRLTKHQIQNIQNILPFYDSVRISRREHAHKYYAETYDV